MSRGSREWRLRIWWEQTSNSRGRWVDLKCVDWGSVWTSMGEGISSLPRWKTWPNSTHPHPYSAKSHINWR